MSALVLCGSLGSTKEMWASQFDALPGALVVEHPGHGAPLEHDVSIDALARRLLARVNGPVSLVGLSLGGAVVLRAAAIAPERVERVVLACTSTRFGEPQQWLERAEVVRRDGLEAIVDAVLARWFTTAYGDVGRWRAMFLSVDREGYARCCEALARWDGTSDLRAVRAPALVIAGSEDPTSPPAHAEAIASQLEVARVAVLDGAAHLANVERAAEFNQLTEEHLWTRTG